METANIQELANKCNRKLGEAFGFSLENIGIKIAETRAEYDKIVGRKTESWQIASAQDGLISIVSPSIWDQEGAHKVSELEQALTHEVVHLYVEKLAPGKKVPSWLNEGLAGYLSDQHKKITNGFCIENFTQVLGSYQGFIQYSKAGAYSMSFLFVAYLIQNFGLGKIKELLGKLNNFYYYDRFSKQFSEVFGTNLLDVEKDFLESLD